MGGTFKVMTSAPFRRDKTENLKSGILENVKSFVEARLLIRSLVNTHRFYKFCLIISSLVNMKKDAPFIPMKCLTKSERSYFDMGCI